MPGRLLHWASSRWVLWSGLALAHAWLCFVNLYDAQYPLGDVTLVYRTWMQQGFSSHNWVGLDVPWVYPILAIVPMLLAWSFGPDNYAYTWLALVIVLDAVAFGFLIGWVRTVRNAAAAWWWLGFLVLLGPIALARLDTVTVPLALVGVLFAASRPKAAAVILTIAAWVKVWPGALLIALVIAAKARWRILTAAVLCSAAIIGLVFLLGNGPTVLSFITQQSDRGLQVEAPVSTPWLWLAFAGQRHAHVYYDRGMLTYQVTGDGSAAVSALMTPLLVFVVLALVLLAVLAARRGATAVELFPTLALALVTSFIAFNKVGSPQYMAWLAVPIILGLVVSNGGADRPFRVPAGITAVLAALTQLIFPWFYDELLALDSVLLVLLTARNLLLFVLLGWAVVALCDCVRERSGNALQHERLEPDTQTTLEG
jgi:hypothetical protein